MTRKPLVSQAAAKRIVRRLRKDGDLGEFIICIGREAWHFGNCNAHCRHLFQGFLIEELKRTKALVVNAKMEVEG